MKDFPFDIYDVAEKLGLEIKHQHPKSADYDCPFCGGKAKLNLNIELNVYRCNKCGINGGMLDLFCKCTNSYSKSDAYKFLAGTFDNSYSIKRHEYRQEIVNAVQETQKANAEIVDRCYFALLEELTLEQKHRQNLLNRGLSNQFIDFFHFRSVPESGYDNLISKLLKKDCNPIGVPGFYVNDNGEIKMNLYPCLKGIFIPVYNSKLQIQGLQIRLDNPRNKNKYMWFSSSEKNGGCSSGSPVQVCGDIYGSKAVYVTEGPLKCQIAHFLSGKPFIAVAGVNQQKGLEKIFDSLRINGKCKMIIDAFDMDDNTNPNVKKGHNDLMLLARRYGFEPYRITWDRSYKGIDDFLLNCICRKQNHLI